MWSPEQGWLVPPDQRAGFIEAYIWCELNYVDQPTETYSSSPYYYEERIGEYLMAHPKAVNQPLAELLYIFRDKPKANCRSRCLLGAERLTLFDPAA